MEVNNYMYNDNVIDDDGGPKFLAIYLNKHGEMPNVEAFSGITKYQDLFKRLVEDFKEDLEHHHIITTHTAYEKKEKWVNSGFAMFKTEPIFLHHSYDRINIYYKERTQLLERLISFCKKYCRIKREKPNLSLIIEKNGSLTTQKHEIKAVKLDINSSYNDDFTEINEIIQKRLKTKQDKGIVLLHGNPGTGKTTYLRYLIGQMKGKKKMLFLPSNLAHHITSPSFMAFLLENPNVILIIEDAEDVIMDRQGAGNSGSVANILNISDGLLSDVLNIQIVCTFNCPINNIDEALMRKGRLIAKYEFGKLSIDKSKALSKQLGFDTEVTEEMTIGDIYNQDEKSFTTKKKTTIGFGVAN